MKLNEIVYLSTMCSNKHYNELFKNSKIKPSQQMQKYNIVLAEGIAHNENINITAVTTRPISKSTSSELFYNSNIEMESKMKFVYLPIVNIKGIRAVISSILLIYTLLKFLYIKKNYTIICDSLHIPSLLAATIMGKIFRIQTIGIVTDVPGFFSIDENNQSHVRMYVNHIFRILISSFDGYVFLSKFMNEVLNKKNKPFCIIEGQSDYKVKHFENKLQNKTKNKKICMYAGSISESNGIDILIKAFIQSNIVNVELHLYGNGPYKKEAKKISEGYSNIIFFDPVMNDEIIIREMEADLLINPRPSDRDFVKYSFPSKIMEYIVSGTPILTTKLPSMPDEYYDYVYLIEDESISGLSKELTRVLAKSKVELNQFGVNAKEWAMINKSNVVQGDKVISLIHKLEMSGA